MWKCRSEYALITPFGGLNYYNYMGYVRGYSCVKDLTEKIGFEKSFEGIIKKA